ncbi:MAG: DUF2784 domain-containing protein [Gammaproteobacteria bacterium]|nr:DUF2784 domain-containing protein [Gammaproteobacteria bacterium]
MNDSIVYRVAADLLLFMHTVLVGFIVFGLLLILIGKFQRWRWIRNPWFRYTHLAAIGVVVAQSWLGVICPLTTWEMALREKAGDASYTGAFIAHWLESVLYYQLPPWVFVLSYTLFGLLVAAAWLWIRPRRFAQNVTDDTI